MRHGDLFELKTGGPVYRVEERVDFCTGCAGVGHFNICQKLPFCQPKDGSYIFRKLSPYDERQARKKGVEIELLEK
ncbi:MAG: hypothetical protein LBR10_10790 [Prevotellaceae bacterium]|jgi:hypothetical protein|nr:hypothetical protein [Prevotellaceae bacterium]